MTQIYKPSEAATFYAQVLNADGSPANAATVTLTVWKSDGTKFLDGVSMTYITNSHGLYKYDFTAPATVERMVANVSSTSPVAYGSEDIYVAEWTKDIATIEGKLPTDYIMGSSVQAAKDDEIDAIKAKTDNLPASPAPANEYDTQMARLDVAVSSRALETTAQSIKIQTDKLLFDASNFLKSIAQNPELAHLDADISTRETPAHVTAEVDDLITRAKGLNEIYDSVAIRALEATLTAIKGAGFTSDEDALRVIRQYVDELESGLKPKPKASFSI